MRSNISLLDEIKISAPCLESWEAMEGDERVRHCNGCKQNVYNLSGMTQSEAEDLLQAHEGGLCVRLYQRDDGSVITKNCPTGVRALRERAVKKWVAISYAVAALALGFWRVAGGIYAVMWDIRMRSASEAMEKVADTPDPNLYKLVLPLIPVSQPPVKQEEVKPEPDNAVMGFLPY